LKNTWDNSNLPKSYKVPQDYWKTIPVDPFHNQSRYEAACGRVCTPQELDNYRAQSEMMLTNNGLNLYDGAVREIALALLGHAKEAIAYELEYLIPGKTLQLASIRGSSTCVGITYFGQCSDDNSTGACGFCYGGNDGSQKGVSLDSKHAFFFRMVGDVWSYTGTTDLRCSEKNIPWIWNDWRPVAGENAWLNLIGPLQTAYINAGKNANSVDDSSSAVQLSVQILDAIKTMIMPNGAIAYAPYNTWDQDNEALGGTSSVENAASTLAGLKIFAQFLTEKTNTQYKNLIPQIQDLITKVTNYLKSAYNPSLGYFVQGGSYTKTGWAWNSDPNSSFAVDCQTWVMSVLGAPTIDGWFGNGTALKIWQKTKETGGWGYDSKYQTVLGVGFSYNQKADVLSGEWSFGAVNMLRIFAKQYNSQALFYEAEDIRQALDDYLTTHDNAISSDVIKYSSKRYYIPFGWWANPIPSMASAGWAVFVDSNYNPFVLGGAYV